MPLLDYIAETLCALLLAGLVLAPLYLTATGS